MKMGLLSHADVESEKYTVEFEVTVAHDIGFEIQNGSRMTFFTMIRRGTPYSLAKKTQIFTLSGEEVSDMTNFNLKILERIDRNDPVEDCKLIGDIEITGLPERPSGKTKLSITLLVEEEGGLVKGTVEDVGTPDYPSGGFKQKFEPSRYNTTVLEG